MSRPSDQWCCMNCAHKDKCVETDPELNLLDFCAFYEDADDEED